MDCCIAWDATLDFDPDAFACIHLARCLSESKDLTDPLELKFAAVFSIDHFPVTAKRDNRATGTGKAHTADDAGILYPQDKAAHSRLGPTPSFGKV